MSDGEVAAARRRLDHLRQPEADAVERDWNRHEMHDRQQPDAAVRQRLTRRRAEARRSEGDASHRGGGDQSDDRAGGRHEGRLGPSQPHDARGRCPANPKESLLAPTPFPSGRGDHASEQRRDDHARQAEEQEQQLRVDGVGTRAIQLRRQVVPDRTAAREGRFEVLRATDDLGERRAGVGGQVVGELHMDLRGGRPRRGVREQRVPRRVREQDHVVRRSCGRRSRRDTDRLEQRVGSRQVDDAGDRHRRLGLTRSPDRDRGTPSYRRLP